MDDAPTDPLAFRPRSFTPDTLAERWSCSPQHIRDLIHANRLACFRVGCLMRISADTVVEFEKGPAEGRTAEAGHAGPLRKAKAIPKVVKVP